MEKCYHGHYGNPFETVLIEADSKAQAFKLAHKELKPNTVQSICWVRTDPNPRHMDYMERYSNL